MNPDTIILVTVGIMVFIAGYYVRWIQVGIQH